MTYAGIAPRVVRRSLEGMDPALVLFMTFVWRRAVSKHVEMARGIEGAG